MPQKQDPYSVLKHLGAGKVFVRFCSFLSLTKRWTRSHCRSCVEVCYFAFGAYEDPPSIASWRQERSKVQICFSHFKDYHQRGRPERVWDCLQPRRHQTSSWHRGGSVWKRDVTLREVVTERTKRARETKKTMNGLEFRKWGGFRRWGAGYSFATPCCTGT